MFAVREFDPQSICVDACNVVMIMINTITHNPYYTYILDTAKASSVVVVAVFFSNSSDLVIVNGLNLLCSLIAFSRSSSYVALSS